jgi:hypothetical protein
MIGLMVVLAAISYFALGGRDGENLAVPCGFGSIIGVFLLVPSLGNPAKAAIFDILRTRAEQIVWIYVFTQRGRGAGSWVVLGFEDGTRKQVTAIMGREQEVIRGIAMLAPRATVGFSPAIEAQFAKAPRELRRR